MKTIKTKITRPFVTIIVLVPVLTLLLFNVAMQIYLTRTAKEDLSGTVSTMNMLIKKQLVGSALTDQRADEVLTSLNAVLKASKLSSHTEFLIFNKNNQVLFPRQLNGTIFTDSLVVKLKEMTQSGDKSIVYTIRENGKRFLMTSVKLTDFAAGISPRIVFVASMDGAKGIMLTVNVILIIILLIGVGVSTLIAVSVSKSIAKPIQDLCGYAGRIGGGEFIALPNDESTTEIHELYGSVNEMSRRLSLYDNAQKTFLQNASHELRTPLMSIQGYAEGIAKGVFTNTAKTAEIICEESKRLNALVEELLILSRIENKTYACEVTQQNVCDVVKDYIQRINGFAMKENKRIFLTCTSEKIIARIDENLLAQAVINIISNGIKYATSEVRVEILTQDRPIIRISDDGKGISPTDFDHIFDRFYKGKNGNFGLGLAIAKSAVEYMGGSISAYNQGGAVFEIKL